MPAGARAGRANPHATNEIANAPSEIARVSWEMTRLTSEIARVSYEIASVNWEMARMKCEITRVTSVIARVARANAHVSYEIVSVSCEIASVSCVIARVTSVIAQVSCAFAHVSCAFAHVTRAIAHVWRIDARVRGLICGMAITVPKGTFYRAGVRMPHIRASRVKSAGPHADAEERMLIIPPTMSSTQRQRKFRQRHPGYDRLRRACRKARISAMVKKMGAELMAASNAPTTAECTAPSIATAAPKPMLLLPAPVADPTMAQINAMALDLARANAKAPLPRA
jgi:hypothetical protein